MSAWKHRGGFPAPILCLFLIGPLGTWPSAGAATSLDREHHCMALAMYWEARGEPEPGMTAVGWTILNRVRDSRFPSTPCGVVFEGGETPPCQFSWWCDGRSDRPRDRHAWTRARIAAATLMTSPPPDPTGGALFFHSSSISARWFRTRTRTARIGNHVFYR